MFNKAQAMTNEEFWATVTPALLSFLSVAVPAILSYIAYVVQGWVAKVKEGKDREALHSALNTGIKSAETSSLDSEAKVLYAVNYARKSVPDAIANLAPSPEVMTKLAQSKLEENQPCPPEPKPSVPLRSSPLF
jgi:hypothetical protein